MDAWRRFFRLGGEERRIVLEAAAGLLATRAGLRLVGFRRWQKVIGRRGSAVKPNGAAAGIDIADRARVVARLEAAAARNLVIRTNCLEQSLVLWWLLRRRGLAAEIRFGARKEAERFEAHAWVEVSGMILNEAEETHLHFVPFEGSITPVGTEIS